LVLAGVVAAGCGGGQSPPGEPLLSFARARPGYGADFDVAAVRPDGRGIHALAGPRTPSTVVARSLPRASWSPDGRSLAFTGTELDAAHTDVYAVGVGGGTARRVTRTGDAVAPIWTPDGHRIVFARRRSSFESSLWSIDADGGQLRRLARASPDESLVPSSMSPDGRELAITRVACVHCRPWHPRIVIARADGSRQREVVADGRDAAYSPDGRRLVFASARDRNGRIGSGRYALPASELYVSAADGTHARRLTNTPNVNEGYPSWSPDGARIAYQRLRRGRSMAVWQVNADGTCARDVLSDRGTITSYYTPVWRPVRSPRLGPLRC
jgi:Tol biopolymer transport system component